MGKILIFGLKKSGTELVKFLCDDNDIVVYDEDKGILEDFIKKNKSKYRFEVLNLRDNNGLEDFDLAIKSPGIPNENMLIRLLKTKNIKIENEMDFASKFISGDIISVTGTNGKSTVVSLINEIFSLTSTKCYLAGNIGYPLTQYISKVSKKDRVVVESSSFQLDDIFYHHPKIAVFLNIKPDHISWHGSFDNYFKAKQNVFKFQTLNDFAVLNYDDELVRNMQVESNVYFFSLLKRVKGVYLKGNSICYFDGESEEEIVDITNLNLLADHVVSNYLAATCVCKILNIDNETIKLGLMNFKQLPHRYEIIAQKNGVLYVNDSKATNIASTYAAVISSKNNIHLLLGGSDKGENFDNLFDELVKNKIKKAYIFGQTADKISESAKKFNVDFVICDNLEDATTKACRNVKREEIVLLSPACASFDEFVSFEHRGCFYKELINRIIYE